MTYNHTVVCDGDDCGKIQRLPFTIVDELGGTFTCQVCSRDLHPQHELNADTAPVVTTSDGDIDDNSP